MALERYALTMLAVAVIAACGERGGDDNQLDLLGEKKGGSTATGSVSETLSLEMQGEPQDDFISIDLIQDLVFRNQRDGWSLTTPHAHVNIEKLRRSGLDLVFSALPIQPGVSAGSSVKKSIAVMNRLVRDSGGAVEIVSSYKEAKAVIGQKKIAMMLMMEGADAFVGAPELLATLRRQGLSVVGLVGGRNNGFADTAVFPRDPGGLTEKGKQFLLACRDTGIAVDLTHASPNAFWDTLTEQAGMVMVSHTAVRALMEHPRNLSDIQILGLIRYGGLMGLLFNPDFVKPGTNGASISDIVTHIKYVKSIGGMKALALGTDYGGIHPPKGLEDVSKLSELRIALSQQGFSSEEIAGLMGRNAERFLEELTRETGAMHHTADEIVRPVAVDCESVQGEFEGMPVLACNSYVTDQGAVIPPASRHKVRIRNMTLQPIRLELFGEPGVPWQVEGQNLAGKILFHRFVQLDDRGRGEMSLPSDRNVTRMFCSPTRASALKEIVVWGRKPVEDK